MSTFTFAAGDTIKFNVAYDPFNAYKEDFTVLRVDRDVPFIGFRAELQDKDKNHLLFIPKLKLLGNFFYPERFQVIVVKQADVKEEKGSKTPSIERIKRTQDVFRASI